ncbi:hypothetical protein [Roseovarius sp.]
MVPGVRFAVDGHPPEETYPVLSGEEFTHGDTPWLEPGSVGPF